MTFNANSTTATMSGASGTPAHAAGPLALWHAIRQGGRFLADVADDAGKLRRSLHQQYPTVEE